MIIYRHIPLILYRVVYIDLIFYHTIFVLIYLEKNPERSIIIYNNVL